MNAPADFPRTVLLVDDEEVVLDLLSRMLTRAELPFVPVKSGREALALLEQQPFGCLVSDKNLPDVSGIEVLRAARRLQPFCACILITGYSTTDSVLEVLRLGASDYVEKPFPDLKLLLQRIRTAMAHRRAEFERNTLVEALKALQDSMAEKSAEAFRQKTEREVLETVLDLRVEESTRALRERVAALEAEARSEKELSRALAQQLDGLVDYVRHAAAECDSSAQVQRGVLREIERRLEDGASLLGEGED